MWQRHNGLCFPLFFLKLVNTPFGKVICSGMCRYMHAKKDCVSWPATGGLSQIWSQIQTSWRTKLTETRKTNTRTRSRTPNDRQMQTAKLDLQKCSRRKQKGERCSVVKPSSYSMCRATDSQLQEQSTQGSLSSVQKGCPKKWHVSPHTSSSTCSLSASTTIYTASSTPKQTSGDDAREVRMAVSGNTVFVYTQEYVCVRIYIHPAHSMFYLLYNLTDWLLDITSVKLAWNGAP